MATQLTAEERETAFTQSAEDRKRGVVNVYSCDPYWMTRLARYGKLIRKDGDGAWYEIEHRQLSLRKPSHMLAPRTVPPTGGFRRKAVQQGA